MPKKDRTLLIVKPDGVKKRLLGEILRRVEREGFRIIDLKLTKLTLKEAQNLYQIHKKKRFFDSLVRFITSGPILAILLERNNATQKLREIIGATNPKKAEPGTIRADFGTSILKNIVHAANPDENPKREIALFFKTRKS